jgi:hypothetical protein
VPPQSAIQYRETIEATLTKEHRFAPAALSSIHHRDARRVGGCVLGGLMRAIAKSAPRITISSVRTERRDLEHELSAGTLDAAIDVTIGEPSRSSAAPPAASTSSARAMEAIMGFEHSPQGAAAGLNHFIAEHIYPNEQRYQDELHSGNRWQPTVVIEELKRKARAAGLWNLFLPQSCYGAGLTNLEYAPLCEILGRVDWAAAEMALEKTCRRLNTRVAFGKKLAEQSVMLERVAEARIAIDQAQGCRRKG